MTKRGPRTGTRPGGRYVATRGVSWREGEDWVNREAGDDVSDAPAGAIEEWLALDPPAVEARDGEI